MSVLRLKQRRKSVQCGTCPDLPEGTPFQADNGLESLVLLKDLQKKNLNAVAG